MKRLGVLVMATLLVSMVGAAMMLEEPLIPIKPPPELLKVELSPLAQVMGKIPPRTFEMFLAMMARAGIKPVEHRPVALKWEEEEAIIKGLEAPPKSGYWFEGTLHMPTSIVHIWWLFFPLGAPKAFAIIWNEGDLANIWNDLDLYVFAPGGGLACFSNATKTIWEGCRTTIPTGGLWIVVVHMYSGLFCYSQLYKGAADVW